MCGTGSYTKCTVTLDSLRWNMPGISGEFLFFFFLLLCVVCIHIVTIFSFYETCTFFFFFGYSLCTKAYIWEEFKSLARGIQNCLYLLFFCLIVFCVFGYLTVYSIFLFYFSCSRKIDMLVWPWWKFIILIPLTEWRVEYLISSCHCDYWRI